MSTVERYLKPEVARQIRRLDLRAKFIVKGFLHGLHASPLHGFSVEFSEHRKYVPGDDPADIDWLVYAKTDKYYVKKFEAETNLNGFLVLDASQSMGYTLRQELTKFDYAICLAAALCYLMIQQQDPVGMVTFDEKIRHSLAPSSRRSQLANILALLSRLKPGGRTHIGQGLAQLNSMLRHQSLVMVFSDLLGSDDSLHKSLSRLRHHGHDVILFHILDEAEVRFPFSGMMEFEDPESNERIQVHADEYKSAYLREVTLFRETCAADCAKMGVDYLPLDTSMPFDKALLEYLLRRRSRF